MDKGRHPNVVRTWTVERTKVRCPSPPTNLRSRSQKNLLRGQGSGPIRPPRRTRPWSIAREKNDHGVPTANRDGYQV
jgi:hypothetical protein